MTKINETLKIDIVNRDKCIMEYRSIVQGIDIYSHKNDLLRLSKEVEKLCFQISEERKFYENLFR